METHTNTKYLLWRLIHALFLSFTGEDMSHVSHLLPLMLPHILSEFILESVITSVFILDSIITSVFPTCVKTLGILDKKLYLRKQFFNNFDDFPMKFSLPAGVVHKQLRDKSNVTGDNFMIMSLNLILSATLAIALVTI